MPMPEILEVTDGEDTVSFLNEGSGFVLKEWSPKIAQPKDGGVWKDSGIADGRQLAMIRYENVEEEFILAVTGENQNPLYRNMRKLRALLLKAQTYWLSGFAYEPVWLKIKGKNEVYPRYSIITGWNYESESNPFHPPVGGTAIKSVMDDWSLFIERKPYWSNISPRSENAIEASNITSYDGRTLGNVDSAGTRVPTTAAEVFFTNKHLISNITDIYENDGAAWSANLLDAALPHRLLPAVPAVNDAIYFGTDILVADSGPLSSLIFDIGTAAVGVTGQWEYWNGAWVVFPFGGGWIRMADNTDGFSNVGVNGAFWDQPFDWATVVVNGVDGWWVRFRVTGIAAPTGAEQQNRDIYVVTWPYIEIQDDQITGDIPALLKMRIRNESNYDDDDDYEKYIDHLICGTRRVSRGEDFSAYSPLADTQLLTGQTVTLDGNAIYINDIDDSPRYRSIQCNAGIGNGSGAYTTLDNTIANQYTGRFHMYLRYGGGGDWEVSIQTSSFGNLWFSDVINPPRSEDVGIIDFGAINLPPAGFGNNETVEELIFYITLDHIAGATTFELYNIILLPVDEWAGSFYGFISKDLGEYGPNLWGTNYLDIDSVTNPKKSIYSPVRVRASGNLESQWTNSAANPATLELERRTRIWFIALSPEPVVTGEKFFNLSYAHSIQLFTAQRYLSAIGESL